MSRTSEVITGRFRSKRIPIFKRKKTKQSWVNESVSFDVAMLEYIDLGVREPSQLADKLNCDIRKIHVRSKHYLSVGVLEKFNGKLYLKPLEDQ